jgi:hypothetical protein
MLQPIVRISHSQPDNGHNNFQLNFTRNYLKSLIGRLFLRREPHRAGAE